jgi:hypothetical protein
MATGSPVNKLNRQTRDYAKGKMLLVPALSNSAAVAFNWFRELLWRYLLDFLYSIQI